jgi:steroid delta-isomerase-like uncharacterized protein
MPQQSNADIAKASVIAYNDKNWNAARASIAPGVVYDEVATQRKAQGADDVISLWQGWAKALPDSRATFDHVVESGNTVLLELTWRGTHSGPLQTPAGQIPATGKPIEVRACQVIEVADGKARVIRQYFDMVTLFQQLGIAVQAGVARV